MQLRKTIFEEVSLQRQFEDAITNVTAAIVKRQLLDDSLAEAALRRYRRRGSVAKATLQRQLREGKLAKAGW